MYAVSNLFLFTVQWLKCVDKRCPLPLVAGHRNPWGKVTCWAMQRASAKRSDEWVARMELLHGLIVVDPFGEGFAATRCEGLKDVELQVFFYFMSFPLRNS